MRTLKTKHSSHIHLLNPPSHEEESARGKQSNYEYQLIVLKKQQQKPTKQTNQPNQKNQRLPNGSQPH